MNSYTYIFTRDEIYDYISVNGYKRREVILDFYQPYSFLNNFFYSIDCNVEIEYDNQNYGIKRNITKYHSPDGTIFFHHSSWYGYYNIYSLNNEKSCKIYVSSYSLDIININSTEIQ